MAAAGAAIVVGGSVAVATAQDQSPDVLPEPAELRLTMRIGPFGSIGSVVFDLDGETVTLASPERATRSGLVPGPYDISVIDAPPRVDLRAIRCSPIGGRETPEIIDPEAGTLTVTLDPGETTNCVFGFLGPRYEATVEVLSEPPGLVEDSSLEVSGHRSPLGVPEGRRRAVGLPVLPAGGLSTITLADLADGLTLDRIECLQTRGDPGTIATAVAAASASLGLAAADLVECTFTVLPELATVQATVLTDGDDVETEFTIEMNGQPVMLLPGELATDDAARADLYRIALITSVMISTLRGDGPRTDCRMKRNFDTKRVSGPSLAEATVAPSDMSEREAVEAGE